MWEVVPGSRLIVKVEDKEGSQQRWTDEQASSGQQVEESQNWPSVGKPGFLPTHFISCQWPMPWGPGIPTFPGPSLFSGQASSPGTRESPNLGTATCSYRWMVDGTWGLSGERLGSLSHGWCLPQQHLSFPVPNADSRALICHWESLRWV